MCLLDQDRDRNDQETDMVALFSLYHSVQELIPIAMIPVTTYQDSR